MTKYTAASGDTDSWTDGNSIVAIFDDQGVETEARIMNILLTLFVVLIFSAGSWIFNNDAKVMIIRPIERLTKLVKKLAGMVFMLSAEEDGDEGMSEGNELDFIDVIADKMSSVFAEDDKMDKKAGKHARGLLPSEFSPGKGNKKKAGLRVHASHDDAVPDTDSGMTDEGEEWRGAKRQGAKRRAK